jgi:hypothetical protein
MGPDTVVVETRNGPRRVLPAALLAPHGYRRCWWCHSGLLVKVGPDGTPDERAAADDLEAAHRLKYSGATPEDRAQATEDQARREFEESRSRAQHPTSGLAHLQNMQF